jgi:hypothetical protein
MKTIIPQIHEAQYITKQNKHKENLSKSHSIQIAENQ